MSDKNDKDKNDIDDATETFDVIDFIDYKQRKEGENLEEEFHEEFNLSTYLMKLREEEQMRKRNLRAKQIKDLAMLFYCLILTIILMLVLINC